MTGKGNVMRIVDGVFETVKDFSKRFPGEKSFSFSGAVQGGPRPAAGEATKRARVFSGLLKRKIARDPELAVMVKKVGDASWAGDANTWKITLNELRQIIQEELRNEANPVDIEGMNDLFVEAQNEVIGYIDNPERGNNTFKNKLDKKLKELNLKMLSSKETETIKNIIKSLELKILPKEKITPGAQAEFVDVSPTRAYVAYHDEAALQMYGPRSINYAHMRKETLDILYHEIYHALNSVLLNLRRSDPLPKEVEPLPGVIDLSAYHEYMAHPRSKAMTQLFEKEFDKILDQQALTSREYWLYKAKKIFGDAHPFSDARTDIDRLIKIVTERGHLYVYLHQLRRYFRRLTDACNATEEELDKIPYWTKIFLVLLNCNPEADAAFEKIARNVASQKPNTRLAERKTKLTETNLRRVIKEALTMDPVRIPIREVSEQRAEELFKHAKTVVSDYVDHPLNGDNTFKIKLNKKLEKLGKPPLDPDIVRKIKKFIEDTKLKLVVNQADFSWQVGDGRFGQYVEASDTVEMMKDWALGVKESRVIEIFYHELYHALDAAYNAVMGRDYQDLSTRNYEKQEDCRRQATRLYPPSEECDQLQVDMQKELDDFLASSPMKRYMSSLFKDELVSLLDTQALQNEKIWNSKSIKLFGFTVDRNMLSSYILRVVSEVNHIYVAVQQIRRAFPGKTLSQICSLPQSQLHKISWWGKVFLTSFKCTREADIAFESIAKNIDKEKTGTRTV